MKTYRHFCLFLLMLLIMFMATMIYLFLTIYGIENWIKPNFEDSGINAFIVFIVIEILLNCIIPIVYLKLIYKFFDKDIYDVIPLYKLIIGFTGLFFTLLKILISYYKKLQGNDEFLKFISKNVSTHINDYDIVYAMILAVSLLAVDYAKSRKELIEKKEIENASYYIYKTNKTKDKKILSYTIRSEINTKTKLKRKK
ncbi:hypothetical protein ACMVYK_02555 [Staphylococcus epidermidis]|uniref:hypothetical protein n=2 Tax=Bacillati TaxID=1783272 RepID=UPI00066AE0F6|nr:MULTISPECIES: hypothetical protein [Staphylococcus]AXE41931.1 hypothetical protein DQW72_08720 [Staphylococcus epidermidis]MBC2970438.1 hypothetical protein [Staphylococcus epidermidis]MBM5934300.1 hypothetical protein [Staphylococcus epidermidis]MBM5936544.1 hypothetical protein [Staphylococcus epidermidis]MBM5941020.1 hypothetical protein [Staphylococcus epidermidis]